MNAFLHGLVKGLNESPMAFFAPAIIPWRMLVLGTEELIQKRRIG